MFNLQAAGRRWAAAAAFACTALVVVSCARDRDASILGTFRMGEKVQAGPLVYTVTESQWKAALSEGGRASKHRFLFLHVSIANSGSQEVAVPGLELIAPDGKTYAEQTEGVEEVAGWLSAFRNLQPGETQTGWVVFDAPPASYKLSVSDAGEVASEKRALIEIPVQLE